MYPFKGAAKLHFLYYSRVVIILFSKGLCKSVFSTYSFVNLGYCLAVFLCFFFVLYFEFNVVLKDFKVELLTFQTNWFIYSNESPLKITKNAFYFFLKTLFDIQIFRFLSWLLGHVVKTAWLER